MIWGLILLILYVVRKYKADHQVLDWKSEKDKDSFRNSRDNLKNPLKDFFTTSITTTTSRN